MVKAKKRYYMSRKNKKSQNRKNQKRNRSRRRKKQSQKGGKWASWEGASTMNHPFANLVYNRFVRAPFLTEMGDLSPYN